MIKSIVISFVFHFCKSYHFQISALKQAVVNCIFEHHIIKQSLQMEIAIRHGHLSSQDITLLANEPLGNIKFWSDEIGNAKLTFDADNLFAGVYFIVMHRISHNLQLSLLQLNNFHRCYRSRSPKVKQSFGGIDQQVFLSKKV